MPFVVWPRLSSIKAKGIDYLARIIFTPWTAGLFFFALATGLLSGGLRARITLPASLIIAALFGAAAASRFDSRERRLMAALFSASLLLQALPEIVHPSDHPFYQFAWRASLVILGWSFAFSLFLIPPGTSPRLPEQRPRKQLAALIIVSFIGLSRNSLDGAWPLWANP